MMRLLEDTQVTGISLNLLKILLSPFQVLVQVFIVESKEARKFSYNQVFF